METIIITVCGGLINGVSNIPPGVMVEVRDYDIDECNEHLLPKDECKECFGQDKDGDYYFFYTEEG